MTPNNNHPPYRFRLILTVLVAVVLPLSTMLSCATHSDQTIDQLYRQANEFYEAGQFGEASLTYERIVQRGFRNGSAYYNLGNAYFKQNKLGPSILAYERAVRLQPRDRDVAANLAIANLRIVDRIEIPDPLIDMRLIQVVSVNEITTVVSASFILFMLTAIACVLSNSSMGRRRLYRFGLIFLLLTIVSGTVAGIRVYDHVSRSEAIVLDRECEIRSGPSDTYDRLFSLHEGTKVGIVEERSGWQRISLPDGKEGWVSRESLATI